MLVPWMAHPKVLDWMFWPQVLQPYQSGPHCASLPSVSLFIPCPPSHWTFASILLFLFPPICKHPLVLPLVFIIPRVFAILDFKCIRFCIALFLINKSLKSSICLTVCLGDLILSPVCIVRSQRIPGVPWCINIWHLFLRLLFDVCGVF